MKHLQTFENYSAINESIKTYKYSYSCVSPISIYELEDIIDNMKEITSSTLFKHVDYEDGEIFGKSKKELLNDYHVRYYRCPKYDCYVIVHSGIEHIYKNTVEKSRKERDISSKADYKLLKTYNNYNVGDNIENFGKITKIFSYPNGQVQFEIDKNRYYNSSYFE